jgi:hypothetical protein
MPQTEAMREWRRADYRKNPAPYKRRAVEYQKRYPEKAQRYRRATKLRRYGLEIEDYDILLESQNGLCAICGKPPTGGIKGKSLHVDHDHKTGQVRGLLHQKCNNGLGAYDDNPELLIAAANYLKQRT